ncbi:UDP-glucose--hexose-1-phosphate uridylyltransferase [Paenibacillus sp. NPDC058071]|uniref:UDP-glucose--hexose-1-phosphate uridylyltransferase n=1 Tax=Paenibacillus sp. NPDC058071 TaxID=3346326 RepID=UPI0036DDF4AB
MTEHNRQPAAKAEEVLLLIEKLVAFARRSDMLEELDVDAARNALLELFRFDAPYEGVLSADDSSVSDSAVPLLEPLIDYGYSIGLIEEDTTTYRDLLDARIMGLLMPRPSETAAKFRRTADQDGLVKATDEFYKLNIDSHYIQMDRIQRNAYWEQPTPYGGLEITINLSKPEKDPKEIARLKTLPQAHYPKCLLCRENVGYAGRADHPARQNLRVLPLQLQGEQWFFQYSPYVYYNEHSIVFKGAHEPMAITHSSFARLLDFVEQFPHYFIGSNADLPIVGGSILSHDHFQAGRHTFAMEKAAVETTYTDSSQPGVTFGTVAWPLSVVRVTGESKQSVHAAACRLLDLWREYRDAEADIFSYTDNADGSHTPHNTITPIARIKEGWYEMDLVLRNNRTSEEHPGGIFHPHAHLHHIKKENIGLIEVMGLAVLPGRLKDELEQIAGYLAGERVIGPELQEASHPLNKHAEWLEALIAEYGTELSITEARAITEAETGNKFLHVLEDCGVYKRTGEGAEAFRKFMISAGLTAVSAE